MLSVIPFVALWGASLGFRLLQFEGGFGKLLDLNKAFAFSIDKAFEDFTRQFQKAYESPTEASYRQSVFLRNLEEVTRFEKKGDDGYHLGVNRFSDLTFEEFESKYLMKNVQELSENLSSSETNSTRSTSDPNKNGKLSVPKSTHTDPASNQGRRLQSIFDLLDSPSRYSSPNPIYSTPLRDFSRPTRIPALKSWKNFATPVKDQDKCAACYAFAALSAIEIVTRSDSLSAQQIIDCSPLDDGCVGGNPLFSLDYLRRYGAASEESYSFSGSRQTCRSNSVPRTRIEVRYERIRPSVLEILNALQRGPVAVVHVANNRLKAFSGGIYADQNCNGRLNHAATIVGYNLKAPTPFFELKNAWGSSWGEQGYYRMAIGPLTNENPGLCRMLDNPTIVSVTA